MRARCETCVFWQTDPARNPQLGQCRRYPPLPMARWNAEQQREVVYARWPIVAADAWCGEHTILEAPAGDEAQ